MLIPSTITARRTRRYKSTLYIRRTIHGVGYDPYGWRRAGPIYNRRMSAITRPHGPLYLRRLHQGAPVQNGTREPDKTCTAARPDPQVGWLNGVGAAGLYNPADYMK